MLDNYYIDPEDATHIRIFRDGTWFIDAADDEGNYTEVCYDSNWHTYDECIGAGWCEEPQTEHPIWSNIESLEEALQLKDKFAQEVVPHLVGTKPKVKLSSLQATKKE